MKLMSTKYIWNAKKSVHFIDVFMGGTQADTHE